MSDLDGATTPPDEGVRISSADEFAAVWNSLTDEQRAEWWVNIREAFDLYASIIIRDLVVVPARELYRLQQTTMPEPPSGASGFVAVPATTLDPIQELHEAVGALLRRALRQLDYAAEHAEEWGIMAYLLEQIPGARMPSIWERLPPEVMEL